MSPLQTATYGDWEEFERAFNNGKQEKRYIQQITFDSEKPETYWRITTDTEQLPKNQTWYVKTDLKSDVSSKLGNFYGIRNWVEYAFKQGKNELGWADFRLTEYHQIEKWWEIVLSVYFFVSLHAQARNESFSNQSSESNDVEPSDFSKHEWWDFKKGWKSTLNNLILVIQPYIFGNLIKPWLTVFINKNLEVGFHKILEIMNCFPGYVPVDSG